MKCGSLSWDTIDWHYTKCPTCKRVGRREGCFKGELIQIFRTKPPVMAEFLVCYRCRGRQKVSEIRDRVAKAKVLEEEFDSIKCEIGKVCPIFHAHHNILIDDPERLTTEFCIRLTCGNDGWEKYQKSKGAE